MADDNKLSSFRSPLTPTEKIFLILTLAGICLCVVIGALAVAGVIDMNAAQLMLVAAWLIAVAGAALVEWLSARPRRRILISTSVTAIVTASLLLALNVWIVRKKAEQEHKPPPIFGEWLSPVTTYMQSLPWRWIAIGLAVGFLIGLWLRGLRQRPQESVKSCPNPWVHKSANSELNWLWKFVLVTKCTIDPSHLSEDNNRFIDFTFFISNLSMFAVSVTALDGAVIDGPVYFKGKMLSGTAKMFENHVKRVEPTTSDYFIIRQWVNQDEAKDISETLKKSGNLFDFSRAKVYINIGEFPDKKPVDLDLTRAMQNAELENENVELRNENNRLKKGLTLWHDSTSRIEELIRTLGMFYLAYNQLEQNKILSKDTANNLKGRFMQALLHCFGDHKREDEYSDNLPPFPDSINEQKVWINSQCEMLRNIIDEQREGLSDYVQKEGSTPNS